MVRVQFVSVHDKSSAMAMADDCLGGIHLVGDGPADWLLAFDDIPRGVSTRIPHERRIAIVTEPPGFRTYWPGYLDQFGTVLTAFETTKVSGKRIISHPCLDWFYGFDFSKPGRPGSFNREQLLSMKPPVKTKELSAVLSTKTSLPMQRRRLEFALLLKERLGDRFDLFGRGFQPIPDKRAALDDYRYHLALENTTEGHFWTEKIADPLIGWSLPLYCGCQAADQYFPEGAFIRLDLDGDIETAIEQVVRVLDEDPYEKHLDAIAEARRRVLVDHTLPAVIGRVIEGLAVDGSRDLDEPQLLLANTQAKPWLTYLTDIPRRWRRGLEKTPILRKLKQVHATVRAGSAVRAPAGNPAP